MKRIIAALLALAVSTNALAFFVANSDKQWVLEDADGKVLLTAAPCTEADIVAQILPQYLGDFRAGTASAKDKPTVPFCYDFTMMDDERQNFVDFVGPNGPVTFPKSIFTFLPRT